jgi:SAM-dependent methyltransferase
MYRYQADFYRYLSSFAVDSAELVVPVLAGVLPIKNVVDFGCGQGAWLSVWRRTGAAVTGVDGAYVDTGGLLIDPALFVAADLGEPIDLGRRFDLVQSLEVAEHLPAAEAQQFVDTLTSHGSCVVFSAAVPGQGGEHHVNEQPLDYWRALFRRRGFVAVDYLRPLIADAAAIAWWYRCNIILYVAEDHLGALPEAVRARRVADCEPLDDYRTFPLRLRHELTRHLPVGAVSRLSRLRTALAARRAGLSL